MHLSPLSTTARGLSSKPSSIAPPRCFSRFGPTTLLCLPRCRAAPPSCTTANERHGAGHLLPTQVELLPKPTAQAPAEPQCHQDVDRWATAIASLGIVFFGHGLAPLSPPQEPHRLRVALWPRHRCHQPVVWPTITAFLRPTCVTMEELPRWATPLANASNWFTATP
jgi:hypothetical protein